MKKALFLPFLALLLVAMVSCEKDQANPVAGTNDEVDFRKKEYLEVDDDFSGCLGLHEIVVEGVSYFGFGAFPCEGDDEKSMVGPYEGTWASVTTEPPRQSGQGATHYVLMHKFTVDDDNYFYTEDRAVCAPANGLPIDCLINDQMTIVGGKGVFENASGKIKTHGPILPPTEGYPFGTIQLHLKGKVYLN